MGATVKSTEFVDDNVLFASKGSANSWRLSMTVDSSNETAEGVAKRSKHVADITQVDGTAINTGSSATDQTTVPALGGTYSEAEVKAAFTALAEKINYLTYKLEEAGLMSES
jgi:hypothetical protein